MIPRDHRAGGLRLTQVDCFMRIPGGTNRNSTGLTDHFMLERRAPTGQDGPLQHVNACFVTQVDVRSGASAWRMTTRCIERPFAPTFARRCLWNTEAAGA